MLIVTDGHTKIAEEMQKNVFWLAWGNVPDEEAWDIVDNNTDPIPDEELGAENLKIEYGRRAHHTCSFVVEDIDGDIEANGKTWSISQEIDNTAIPTRHLYLEFRFRSVEDADKIIRQIGVFTDVELAASVATDADGVPTSIKYFQEGDANVIDKGNMLMYENIPPIQRTDSTREFFNFVITL